MQSLKFTEDQLANLCQECCFGTDKTGKRRCELLLNQYFINITPAEIETILLKSPQIVVFVMSQYIFNNIRIYKEYKPILVLLVQALMVWRADINTFVRYGQVLLPYVKNTYVRLIGELMKRIFNENVQSKKWLYDFVGSHAANMKLLLWKYLIESIDEIDSTMGFLAYRNMIYSFQDETICKIMQVTIPFFNELAEAVKFNELSALQSNLSVNEPIYHNQKRALIFSAQQLATAEVVLDILRSVTSYRYNISYSEYDMESHYENCAICYPERVKQFFIKGDLYDSLFFLAERFIIEQPEHDLLKKSLNCLQKIVLCRISYDSKDIQREFVHKSLKGITKLMRLTDRKQIHKEFVDFNRKMISNIALKKFRREQVIFRSWLQANEKYYLQMIRTGNFIFDNEQIQQSFDLLTKIIDESTNVRLQNYQPTMRLMCQNIFNQIVKRLFSNNHNLTEDISLRKVKHLKKMADDFFACIRVLFCVNIVQNCQTLTTCLSTLFGNFISGANNYNEVTNLLILLMEIVTSETFVHNIFKEDTPQIAQEMLGKLAADTFQFIQLYSSKKTVDYPYLEMKILYETLTGVVIGEKSVNSPVLITTNSRIYNCMGITPPGTSIDPFLAFTFTLLMQCMRSTDIRRVNYCMEALNTCLTKFKLTVNREVFKQMELPKLIFKYCLELAKQQFMGVEMVKCRINLFKIITLVGFDDCLDNYREKLKCVFQTLQINSGNKNFFILVYDMRGIASQIDAGPVYRYFLTKTMPMIKKIFESLLVQQQQDKILMMKHSLRLCRALVENKSQRLSLTKTIPLSYELVGNLLPYWSSLLVELNRQQHHDFQVEIPIAYQLFKIFCEVMRGSYINFFLLSVMKPRQTQSYMTNLLKYIGTVHTDIPNHPKAFENYLSACYYISRQLTEFIFTYNSSELITLYANMFLISFRLLQVVLKEHINGNSKNQKHIDKILDVMISGLSYVKTALSQTHKATNHSNANLFKTIHYAERLQIVASLFEAALQEIKAISILSPICKLLNLFIQLYPESYDLVHARFSIIYDAGQQIRLLDTIYRRTVQTESKKQHDPESFMLCVTEWLKAIDAKAQANATTRAQIIEY